MMMIIRKTVDTEKMVVIAEPSKSSSNPKKIAGNVKLTMK